MLPWRLRLSCWVLCSGRRDSPLQASSTPWIAHSFPCRPLGNSLQLLRSWGFLLLFLPPSLSVTALLAAVTLLWPCAVAFAMCKGRKFHFLACSDGALHPSRNLHSFLHPHPPVLRRIHCWVCVWLISGGGTILHFSYSKKNKSLLPFEIFMFKYIYFAEFRGVFLYQAPPLVWTQQQGFSVKFQHQMGFLCKKKNFFKVTWSLLKALLPMETVKYLDFLLVFIQVFWGSKVNIPKSNLIPSSSLDFKGFQMI